MNPSNQLAKHFREVYFGGNWTAVNLKDTLSDVIWDQAVKKIASFNTIAALTYHIQYYVGLIINVLQQKPLEGHDNLSFDHPPIESPAQWENFLDKAWKDAEVLCKLIEKIPAAKFDQIFVQEKYGTYHRNILGLIEHTHYHLGQIVLIKKVCQGR